MANQNLSQFGEKLFVADADHTFIWDTEVSISKRVSRNSWLNSGTLTSDAPITISQTWNNAAVAFTGLKVNAVSTASASGSLLLDLQVGGVSQFKVNKSGVATLNADGVPQLRMISVTGSGSVFNGLTLETSISTMAGFLVNRSTGEVKIGGLSNAGYFPTFYSNNAEAMRITTAGNVGIGTTAPGAKLEVVGNILVNGATQIIDDGNILSVKGSTTNIYKAGYVVVTSGDNLVTTYQGSVTSGGFFGTFTNHKCFIRTSNAERVTIDTVGNVGIGTTSPTSKLHVASGAINIFQAGTNAGVPYIGVGDTAIYSDALDSLEMRRVSSAAQTIKLYGTYTASPLAYERLTISAPSSGNAIIGTNKTGTGAIARGLEFQTDGVKRIEIQPGGNSIISNTLTVGGNINVGYLLKLASLTVSTLPAASGSSFPTLVGVTDSTVTAAAGKGNTVVGGGSNKVIVMSDGTNWVIL